MLVQSRKLAGLKKVGVRVVIGFVLRLAGRSIPTALSAGAALAFTSVVIDAGGQTTRYDTGKEYYPYTTKKRSAIDS